MSPDKSSAEIVVILNTLCLHFIHAPKYGSIICKGGQSFALVCFIGLIVGFIYSNFER